MTQWVEVLLCFFLLTVSSRAATVIFPLTNFFAGQPATNGIRVTPVGGVQSDGTYYFTGTGQWMTGTTNGLYTNVLNGGNYEALIQLPPNAFGAQTISNTILFQVPMNDTNTWTLPQLQISGGNFFVTRVLPLSPLTNGHNVGFAFYSPGGGNNSEQFGIGANAGTNFAVAYGDNAQAGGIGSVALGYDSLATNGGSVAVGANATATGSFSMSIGQGAQASNIFSAAIGLQAWSTNDYSTAVGQQAHTTASHQIMLGTSNETVYAPGNVQIAGNLNFLNLIPAGAIYTNDTDPNSPINGNGDDYAVPVVPNQVYYFVITNVNNAFYDADLNSIGYPGGFFSTPHNILWDYDQASGLLGQPVQEQVFPLSASSAMFSNVVVSSSLTASNINSSGTVSASTFSGAFSNVASQITLQGASPANLSNGFLPLHEFLMPRQMPVPIYSYTTWFQAMVVGNTGTITAQTCTNMINQLVGGGFVSAGVHPWLEIDEGWSQTNFIRSQHPGSLLNCNSNLFPQGIAAVCAYAHANGVKVMLTTFYSDQFCGASIGALAGSPPGMLYGDITNILTWGVDGICLDSCGVPNSEPAIRQMYLEMDNGISHANSHPAGDFNDGSPVPQIVPTRVANGRAGVQQWSWAASEGNIIFDGNDSGSGSPLDVYIKNINACYTNSWLIRPGHYYTCMNLLDSGDTGTNTLVYQMTAMAILPMPQDIAAIPAACVPWYINSEVVGLYQDPAVIPAVLVSNNVNGYVFSRKLGSANTLSNAIAFFNSNTVSSTTMTIPCTALGIASNAPFTVRDVWSHADLGYFVNQFSQTVPTNSGRLYTATAIPNCVGGGVNNAATASIGSTLAFTNNSGGVRYLRASVAIDVTGTSSGGTIGFTLTSTNQSSGSYPLTLPSISTTAKNFYSTNWTLVVSNTTDVTYTTTVTGSPTYNVLITLLP